MLTLQPASTIDHRGTIPISGWNDITLVCGECGGNGCGKCNNSGTVTIVE
ncbi:hypothetical protein [Amycolatopsis balhimycina]|nr:hypothetical protein [Amycolatopsis balhimycina]